MACTFCEIVAGSLSAHIVLDDENSLGFLDRTPLFKGHVLLIPKEHVVTLPELPTDQLEPLFTNVQRLATAMVDVLGAAGSFVAMNNVVSQSVPHLHVHVVPRNRKDGLRGFFWPRTKYASDDEAAGYAAQLRDGLTT